MPGFTTATAVVSPDQIWNWHTRLLTQAKFPFWSAIIPLTRGSVSVPANSFVSVFIQPPSGETWLINLSIAYSTTTTNTTIGLDRWEAGTGLSLAIWQALNNTPPASFANIILTSSVYVRIGYQNQETTARNGNYLYSGFKLSKPLYIPKRLVQSEKIEPDIISTDTPLPKPLESLQKYAVMAKGLDPQDPQKYVLAILLEKDTPLALDPNTDFPIERLTVLISANKLLELIAKIKKKEITEEETGFKKYFKKWAEEGISVV